MKFFTAMAARFTKWFYFLWKNPHVRNQEGKFASPWLQASVLVIGLSILGKILGLLRELETARLFGVGAEMDAFIAASTLLFFVARMLSDSFLVAIPRLMGRYVHKQSEVYQGDLLRTLLFIIVIVTVLAWLILPYLVPAFFKGLPQQGRQLAAQIIRYLLPAIGAWAVIGTFGGILNFQRRYGGYQLALVVSNIGFLITLWFLVHRMKIVALAWAWDVGLWLGTLAVVLPLRQQIGQVRVWQGWVSQRQVLRDLLAGCGGVSLWFVLNQIPVWIERYYVAQLPGGSLSALGYAQRLFQLPLEMVTTVIISIWVGRVAAMPAKMASDQTFRLMKILAGITFPLGLLLAFLARFLVTVVYARGAFDMQAVAMTTGPFAMYALGLGFHTLSALLVRTFQARGMVRYPLFLVFVDIFLTALLGHYAVQNGWGIIGIAGINSAVAGIRVALLNLFVRKIS